ncbi:MAG TPA: hypothetical protein VJU87_02250 [Gemmatimonadaceae bacterium]|nr:hypothetical protein [Gemmatimonadaceae bacterium]
MRLRLVAAAAVLPVAFGTARAQTLPAAGPPSPPAPAPADSAPHRLPVDTSRMHPVHLVYALNVTQDSTARPLGELRVDVDESTYAGAPAWLLTRAGQRGVQAIVESLYVARADLRPLHWSAAQGLARLAVEFTGDSIFGAMTSPLGKRNIVLAGRRDLLASAGAVDAMLATLPLVPGWHDSASVMVVDPGGSTIAPATLVVEGEELVTAPAGSFDCWIVSLATERGTERLWVRKTDGVVVRSEQRLPQLPGGGAVLERVLETSPTPGAP